MAASFAAPRAYPPAAGRLLLAMPSLQDPNFAGSVVYLLEVEDEAGSAGVVINSATRTPVGQVLPAWHELASAPDVIFRGGPVQADGALCLARPRDPNPVGRAPGLRPVTGRRGSTGVSMVDLDGDTDEIIPQVRSLRVFAGHAGWSPGQLEDEVAEGAWHVVLGRAEWVFSDAPGTLWHRIARAQPNRVALLSTYSTNTALN